MYTRNCNRIASYYANASSQPEIGGGIHPFHELLYIGTGDVQLRWMGRHYFASAPALYLLTPNSPHQLVQLSSEVQGWYIEVAMQDFDQLPDMDTILRWNLQQSNPHWDNRYRTVIESTVASIQHVILSGLDKVCSSPYPQALTYDMKKLMLFIEHHAGAGREPAFVKEAATMPLQFQLSARTSAQEKIFGLVRMLESNYTSDMTLAEMAQQSELTPSYVIKLFKEMTGLTPLQYLQELRFSAAICYLQTTRKPIGQIAELCGFPDIHYFSRMFKQKLGVSPSVWRTRRDGQPSFTDIKLLMKNN